MKRYLSKTVAERRAALHSRNAHNKGDYSQWAMVLSRGMYCCGPFAEIAREFPGVEILAQWSGGYRV